MSESSPKLTIHHLHLSQSERVIWLCEELGLSYTLKSYNRDPQTSAAPASYQALHPVGTAPVLTDGNIVLGETNAIFEYLLSKARTVASNLALPPTHPDYATYLFWLHHANGSLQPALNGLLFAHMQRQADATPDKTTSSTTSESDPDNNTPSVATINQRRVNLTLSALDAQLSKTPYLAGEQFTAADCMMLFPLTTYRLFLPYSLEKYPSIIGYLKRVSGREGWRVAMEKADSGLVRPLGATV
ncbi:glutathione S-transferase family protein [Aspergillus stella-maris]|uniref:glutathione S-transferase family protein n=1 Tax=Aspergillus stella-maris TaxID=1810926 RepID=UPI003CCCA8D7